MRASMIARRGGVVDAGGHIPQVMYTRPPVPLVDCEVADAPPRPMLVV
jgi:hypothetical protein